jgi:chemotaxis protein MotB
MRRSRHDDLENSLNKGAVWAVTYGDLMSYMMIFFLIMFSFGISKKSGGTAADRKYEESLVKIQKVFGGKGSSAQEQRLVAREREESMVTQLKETIDKSNLSQFAKVETWDKKVRLVLAESVVFQSGRVDMDAKAEALLAAVAAQLNTLENPIVVEGHTDNVPVRGGRYSSNLELSMARAYAVVRIFEKNGVAPKRLAGIGYGENRPLGDNATSAGRAKNRRIEIDLIRAE